MVNKDRVCIQMSRHRNRQKNKQKMDYKSRWIMSILKELRRQHHKRLTMLNKESMHSIDINQKAFRVLISTVLSQRNRDEMTEIAAERLFSKYDTALELSKAPLNTIESLIRQSGFYKTKAKRIREISQILLNKYHGIVPRNAHELLELPGVGPKTAGCVLVYAFSIPAIPVDTHVHRISNRIGLVHTKQPEKTEQELMKITPKSYWSWVNELFVLHGKNVCKPITPDCSNCSIFKYCRYKHKNFK